MTLPEPARPAAALARLPAMPPPTLHFSTQPPGDASARRDAVLRLHAELSPVLRGYPIADLLDDYLQAQARRQPDTEGARRLLLSLLQQWADLLWRDMLQLPAGHHALLRTVRRRLATARQALLRLHDAVEDLED